MPQTKIYAQASWINSHRDQLSKAIQGCLVEVMGFDPALRFQRFIPLEPENFLYPAPRSERYTIIEISLFAGRSDDLKRSLIQLLFQRLQADLDLDPMDVEILIFELPKQNWGVRGLVGDQL
jgi:phenylpyruvate tautomerase PptA (4-oxalocrotonate tautomerase family)